MEITIDEARKAKARERAKAWRAANRDRHRAYSRQWADANPERVRKRFAAWYAANKERVREQDRRWKAENRERHLAIQREDQRKRYLGRDEEAFAYSLVLRGDPCSYCGGPGGAIDHVDPLSRGGENDWPNLTAVCIPCNSSKRSKPLLAWLVMR